MPSFSPYLIYVLFLVLLAGLWWLSRRIGLLIQELVYLLTGSGDMAMVVLFLVYLPGILVHEAAHWLMAKLLGLKTQKFRVWPKKSRKYIGLGSVKVASGGPVRDSLVGMAPLLVGTALLVLIGERVFDAQAVTFAWRTGNLLDGLLSVFAALAEKPDGLWWGYILFAIANAMTPSASDREPLKSLALYVVIVGVLLVLLDQSGQGTLWLLNSLIQPMQVLTAAFFFAATIDVAIFALLTVLQMVVSTLAAPAAR